MIWSVIIWVKQVSWLLGSPEIKVILQGSERANILSIYCSLNQNPSLQLQSSKSYKKGDYGLTYPCTSSSNILNIILSTALDWTHPKTEMADRAFNRTHDSIDLIPKLNTQSVRYSTTQTYEWQLWLLLYDIEANIEKCHLYRLISCFFRAI